MSLLEGLLDIAEGGPLGGLVGPALGHETVESWRAVQR